MAIPGYQIIHGAGQRFTMAAGAMMTTMAGNGSPVMNGHLPGLTGAMAAAIMAGRL